MPVLPYSQYRQLTALADRPLPSNAMPIAAFSKVTQLSAGDVLVMPSPEDRDGSRNLVRIFQVNSVKETVTYQPDDPTKVETAQAQFVKVDAKWADVRVHNGVIEYPDFQDARHWHATGSSKPLLIEKTKDGRLKTGNVFRVQKKVADDFVRRLEINAPGPYALSSHIAALASKAGLPDHGVLETRESRAVLHSYLDSLGDIDFLRHNTAAFTSYSAGQKDEALRDVKLLLDDVLNQYQNFTNYLLAREKSPLLIESIGEHDDDTRRLFHELFHESTTPVGELKAATGYVFNILNPDILAPDEKQILHDVMYAHELSTYDLTFAAASDLRDRFDEEGLTGIYRLQGQGFSSVLSYEMEASASSIEIFTGDYRAQEESISMGGMRRDDPKSDRYLEKIAKNKQGAARRAQGRGETAAEKMRPPTPEAMIKDLSRQNLEGPYRIGGGFRAMLDQHFNIEDRITPGKNGMPYVNIPVQQFNFHNSAPDILVDGQRMSLPEYLSSRLMTDALKLDAEAVEKAKGEAIDRISLPRRLLAGVQGSKQTRDVPYVVQLEQMLFQLGMTRSEEKGKLGAESRSSEIEELDRLLKQSGFGKSDDHFLPNPRDFQKRLRKSQSAAAKRLETFVAHLQEKYYGGQAFDPRVAVAYHNNLKFKVVGEAYSAAYEADSNREVFSPEHFVTEESPRIGTARLSAASELNGESPVLQGSGPQLDTRLPHLRESLSALDIELEKFHQSREQQYQDWVNTNPIPKRKKQREAHLAEQQAARAKADEGWAEKYADVQGRRASLMETFRNTPKPRPVVDDFRAGSGYNLLASFMHDVVQNGSRNKIQAIQKLAAQSPDMDAFYRGLVRLSVNDQNLFGRNISDADREVHFDDLVGKDKDGKPLNPHEVLDFMQGSRTSTEAESLAPYYSQANTMVAQKRMNAAAWREKNRQLKLPENAANFTPEDRFAPSSWGRVSLGLSYPSPATAEEWLMTKIGREATGNQAQPRTGKQGLDGIGTRNIEMEDSINELADILVRPHVMADELSEMKARYRQNRDAMRPGGLLPEGVYGNQEVDLRHQLETIMGLSRRLRTEKRNVRRRLFGVLMDDNGLPQLAGPQDIEDALDSRDRLNFFGSSPEHVAELLTKNPTQEAMLSTADRLGLKWSQTARRQDESYWQTTPAHVEDPQAALARVRALREGNALDPRLMHEEAILSIKSGDVHGAVNLLKEAAQINPHNADVIPILHDYAAAQHLEWTQDQAQLRAARHATVERGAIRPDFIHQPETKSPALLTLHALAGFQGTDDISGLLSKVEAGVPIGVRDFIGAAPSEITHIPPATLAAARGRAPLDPRLRAMVPPGLGELSPAQEDFLTEVFRTGKIRHLAFHSTTGLPRAGFEAMDTEDWVEHTEALFQASGMKVEFLPPRTKQDPRLKQLAESPNSLKFAAYAAIHEDPEFTKTLQAQMDRDKAVFVGDRTTEEADRKFRIRGGTVVRDDGLKMPIGLEGIGDVKVSLPQVYEKIGPVTMRGQARQTDLIRSGDQTMSLYKLQSGDYVRYVSHNSNSPYLSDDTMRRAVDFIKKPRSMVYLDTETTLDRTIRNISLYKVDAKGEKVYASDYFTQSFYQEQATKYLKKKGAGEDEFLLAKSMTDRKFYETYKSAGFAFNPKNIRTEEQQILSTYRTLLAQTKDGSYIGAQNAGFDARVAHERAQILAAENEGTALGSRLKTAANFLGRAFDQRLVDLGQVIQIQHPHRAGTSLEVVAGEVLHDFDRDQTHTGLDDNILAARTIQALAQKAEPIPEDVRATKVARTRVLAFGDTAKAPILVDKFLPVDEEVGRQRVQVMGRPLNVDALRRGEIQPEGESRLMHSYNTGYGVAHALQQGRQFLLTPEEAAAQGAELLDRTQNAVKDHAMRLIRKGMVDAPQDREFNVIRGKLASLYGELKTPEEQSTFVDSVLGAAARQDAFGEGKKSVSFANLPEKDVARLMNWMRDDPDGTIQDGFFRQALTQASVVLQRRAKTGDALFLDKVGPLHDAGVMTSAQFENAAAGYQRVLSHFAPLPTTAVESWNLETPRRVTLRSLNADKTEVATKINLNSLNADSVLEDMEQHVTRLGVENLQTAQGQRLAARRLWNDLRRAGVRLTGTATPTIAGMAEHLVNAAVQDQALGVDTTEMRDYFQAQPEIHADKIWGAVAQVERIAPEEMTAEQFASGLANIHAKSTAIQYRAPRQDAAASGARRQAIEEAAAAAPTPPSPGRIIEAVNGPLPDVTGGFSDRARSLFTDAATTFEEKEIGRGLRQAMIGAAALGVTAATITQPLREDTSGGSSTDPGDSATVTGDDVNKIMNADLQRGAGRQQADAGYKKLKVKVSGTFLAMNGSRMSAEALSAIAGDVSKALSGHLQADIDEANSIHHQMAQENGDESPWGVSALMGKILSRRSS